MKRQIGVISIKILVFLCGVFWMRFAFCFDLVGQWVIDLEKTQDFNSKHSNISEGRLALIECLAPNLVLSFEAASRSEDTAGYECVYNENLIKNKSVSVKYKYKVIYSDSETVVIADEVDNITISVDTLYIVNDDLFWIYDFGNQPEYDSHFRYYFQRL